MKIMKAAQMAGVGTDTKTRAQGILASFRNFEFSVCIVALKNILMPLQSKLRKRDLDIYEAFCM